MTKSKENLGVDIKINTKETILDNFTSFHNDRVAFRGERNLLGVLNTKKEKKGEERRRKEKKGEERRRKEKKGEEREEKRGKESRKPGELL